VGILIETKDVNQDTPKVRLSLTLRGDTARIMQELRRRGIVRSYADCVNQAVRLFYEKILEQDIRYARLKAFQSDLEGE
jgi:Arc/MetJ-type ribon-helix-helix transcriptional regulator